MENNPDEGLVNDPSTSEEPTGEAVPNSLNLHSSLPTQVAILKTRSHIVNPINSIDSTNSIEFKITSAENELIVPKHTILKIQGRLLNQDGSVIQTIVPAQGQGGNAVPAHHDDGCEVALTNGLSYMPFKNLTVKLNDTQISHGDGMYAYRADLDTQLTNTVDAKTGSLRVSGYYHEERSCEAIPPASRKWEKPGEATSDIAWHKRFISAKGSQRVYAEGKIHSEIFDQPKVLPPGSSLYLEFTKQPNPDFCYFTTQDEKYQFKIEKMYLLVEKITVDPGIITGMVEAMRKGKNAIFSLRRVQMQYQTRMKSNDFSKPNLFQEGECLPRRIFIVFVESESFKGHPKKDPFNYKNIGIQRFCLRIGGDTIPYPEQTCGSNENDYNEILGNLYRATGTSDSKTDLGIDLEKLKKGTFILAWDLTNSDTPPGVNYELPLIKSCDLEISLKEEPDVYYTMIVYAEYDAEIEVDYHHGVKKKNFGTAE